MPATASIEIVVDDQGAAQAFRNINAEAAKLGPTMAPVQRISEQTFNNIEGGALKARESAALLGEEFGIKIPRALRGVIAESAGIGPAMTAAFSGLAIIGFISIAEEAGKKVAELAAEMLGWGEAVKKEMDAQIALNNVFKEANAETARLKEAYELIGLTGLPRISKQQQMANDEFDAAKKKVSDLTAQLAKLQKQSQEMTAGSTPYQIANLPKDALQLPALTEAAKKALEQIPKVAAELAAAQAPITEIGQKVKNLGKDFDTTFSKDRAEEIKKIATATAEASAKLQEMTSAAKKGGLTGIAQIDADALAQMEAVEKISSHSTTLSAAAAAAVDAIEKEATRKRIALYEKEWSEKDKITQEGLDEEAREQQAQAEKLRRMEDETINAERAAAIASAPPWARANATIIADYDARMDKIREAYATGNLDEQHATRMQTAALQDLYAQRVNELASQMQSLFDDITSGNIGKTFLKLFEQMIFRMVATWIVGMSQMRAASQQQMGSGGGFLNAIFGSLGLGGIFGGGGSGSSGVPTADANALQGLGMMSGLPSFSGDSSSGGVSSIPGMGISSGVAAGTPGLTLPSGAGPAGGLSSMLSGGGGLAQLLAMQAALGISLISSSWGKGGLLAGIKGGYGGLLAGGIVGAIIGFFGSFFQSSTKKARLQIEANIKQQAQTIEDSYDLFQTDWTSSRTALEALRQQGVDALKQAGVKDISRSRVGHVDHWIDKAEKEIDATQADRNARSAVSFGPPQFRAGGFVGSGIGGAAPAWFAAGAMHFAGGGAVPAILHEGEYVLRPEAVSRIGVGNLNRMNSGGGVGDVHVHLNVIDGKSTEDWLRSGGLRVILRETRRARSEGGF